MEKRTQYTIDAPDTKQFHVRFPAELLRWLKAEARRNGRYATAEIVMAVEHWRKIKNK